MAAQALVERTTQPQPRGDETFLFYPIVFLYRHHAELMLKGLIFAFDDPEMRRITQAEKLSEPERKKLVEGREAHSLKRLWEHLRPLVQAVGRDVGRSETIEGINFYIQKLNEFDPYSVQCRYPSEETKDRLRNAQKDNRPVDLQSFAEAMERLANYLEGLDSYVTARIDCHHEMLANYDPR
jgi:hypothetical protein